VGVSRIGRGFGRVSSRMLDRRATTGSGWPNIELNSNVQNPCLLATLYQAHEAGDGAPTELSCSISRYAYSMTDSIQPVLCIGANRQVSQY